MPLKTKLQRINSQTIQREYKNIGVILIDDEATRYDRRLSKPSPISRSYLAELINKLTEDENNKPSVIGVDFILSRHSSSESEDEKLVKALKNARAKSIRLVLVSTIKNNGESVKPIEEFIKAGEAEGVSSTGYVQVTKTKWSNMFLYFNPLIQEIRDKDGEVIAEKSISFPLALALAKEVDATIKNKREFKTISFTPPQRDVYTKNSSCEVLKQCPAKSLGSFKDKILIIGAGYEASSDKFSLPPSSFKTPSQEGLNITGTELIARLTDSITQQKPL